MADRAGRARVTPRNLRGPRAQGRRLRLSALTLPELGPRSRRALRWAATLVCCGALAYGALVGVGAGYDYATTSPRFAVDSLVFTPTPHMSSERLRHVMDIAPGTNLLALELDALRETILADPWVARVTVTRDLPDTLHVAIEEHEAAAVLLTGGALYLVDAQGAPFKRLESGERGELPIITGVKRGWWGKDASEPDRRRLIATVRRGLAIKDAYEAAPRPRLSEIHLGEGGDVTLFTAALGTPLRLGRGPVEPKLARFDALRVALGDKADALAVVHLDVGGGPEDKDRVVASFLTPEDERDVLGRARSSGALAAERDGVAPPQAVAPAGAATSHSSADASARRWSQGQARRIPRYE
ncbi:MAG: FtsQ-type POTRA domain-containing protein [Myxococcales bacterium]|nr:FtsQ-type POTRA domain-containing protein [Myxococcales bacterium]